MKPAAIMCGVLAAVVLATASPVLAASPQDDYFAARDAAIAKFKEIEDANRWDDGVSKAHDAALADLTRQMEAVLGPVAIKDLGRPALNLETLTSSDQGFGRLDGLVLASADDKTRVIVTTEPILSAWLAAHKNWWGNDLENVPQDAAAAVKSAAFYTQAIQTDAAVMMFGALPVAVPKGVKLVVATLAARSQSETPNAPEELFVTASVGGRVFVANAPLARKFAPNLRCEAQKLREETRVSRLTKAGADDTKARQDAEAAYLDCLAGAAPKQPAFAAAVKQAQALLERLPLR